VSAAAVMQRAAAAGVKLTLVDGKVKALGRREAVNQLLEELREYKAQIVVALEAVDTPAPLTTTSVRSIGTIRPAGLSPKLLAASLALDAQILAADLSLTPDPDRCGLPHSVVQHPTQNQQKE